MSALFRLRFFVIVIAAALMGGCSGALIPSATTDGPIASRGMSSVDAPRSISVLSGSRAAGGSGGGGGGGTTCPSSPLPPPVSKGRPPGHEIVWGINAAFVSPHIQAWDLTTGLSVADFAAPTPDAAKGHLKANGRGIAVVGTRIYYAFAGLPNVYMTDTVSHLDLGVAFCTQFPGIGSLSWDGTALWVAPYIPLQQHVPGFQQPPAGINVYRYSPTGQMLATVPLPPAPFYPNPAVPRDDVTVTPSGFVADGGSSVPYSLYDRSGKLLKTYFILSNFRTSGVAFDGKQFIVDNLFSQPHSVSFFDSNGNHIRDQSITGALIPFGLEGISTVN